MLPWRRLPDRQKEAWRGGDNSPFWNGSVLARQSLHKYTFLARHSTPIMQDRNIAASRAQCFRRERTICRRQGSSSREPTGFAGQIPRLLVWLAAVAALAATLPRTTAAFDTVESPAEALKRLGTLKAALPSLKDRIEAVKSKHQDISYPLVTFTVLENFIGYAEEDARHGEVRRALEQIGDLERMAARLDVELQDALAGRRQFAAVPRWTGEKRAVVKKGSFLAPMRIGDVTAQGPVFFTGYGHFGQVVADMEKWPNYGTNIIQIELGPNRVFPQEGSIDDVPIREMLQTLDRAQKAGVAVCLLLSPHYFPDWALAKWPHLRKRREGFLQYCLHAPEGRELLRRFVAAVIVPLKDHPALHSICLSNEPVNEEEPCDACKKQWQAWLKNRHGDIAGLNAAYGSKYASPSDVPLPNPFGKRPELPLWMDFIRFNQESFADWHKMLADAVHEAAPDLLVHAKAMSFTMLDEAEVKFGVDARLFAKFSNINGNDSFNFYNFFGWGDFAQKWVLNAASHDLQRSVLDAPVFNTENHLIEDRDTRYVPASHVRSVLWQEAVHGQGATTIWVWERTFDAKSDFYGSIMHRPACAEAVGLVNYDLNRAAFELTALQRARPQALLLQSVTASVWDGEHYTDCLYKLYTALSFTGLKLGFITERQLEEGVVPDVPVIFVPDIRHLSNAAVATLRNFTGKLVFVGEGDLLGQDEYGRTRSPNLHAETIPFRHNAGFLRGLHAWIGAEVPGSLRDLQTQIIAKLAGWNLRPSVDLRGDDGKAVWGVEWRTAETPAGLVVNLCNYRKTPVTVTLFRAGQQTSAFDVLSGARVEGPLTLPPLEVRLLRLAKP